MIINGVDYFSVFKAALFTNMGEHPTTGEVDWGLRVLVVGPPGSHKTSFFRNLSRSFAMEFFSFKIGSRGEGAVGVVPVPDMKAGVLRYLRPDWTERFDDGRPGLVLLDEMNANMAPALQAPLLGLLQEKEIGSTNLGPRVRTIGVMNPPSQAANPFELAPAVCNRLVHFTWYDPEVAQWTAAALREFRESAMDKREVIDAAKEEARVMKNWASGWSRGAGYVTGYIAANGKLRDQPADDNPAIHGPWQSPRTSEYVIRILASSYVHDLTESETDVLIAGACGPGFAQELRSYIQRADLINPEAWLDGKAEFVHNDERVDRTMVLLNSAAAVIVNPKTRTPKRLAAMWKNVGKLYAECPEAVGAIVAETLIDGDCAGVPEAIPVLKAMRPLLNATQRLASKAAKVTA